GNKRSGTTILAEKINLHPDIYITHETDIIWILYNLYNGIKFEYYAQDEPHSTVVTLEKCKHILDEYQNMTPLECYEKCQYHLMRNGTQWIKKTDKVPLILGDKKPNQQSEVLVNNWVEKHFSNTKYIHIVRHPFDFLSSIPRLLPKYDLGARYGSPKCKDPVKILETWAYFEALVIQEKEKKRFPIHSVKFEDFCDHPGLELSKIWNFSDLSIPSELKDKIAKNDNFGILPGGLHGDSRGNKFSLKVPDKVKKIMDFYDYKIF
ncbi:MAG: sulfotransferase, partial [Desulfobacteraceae bacterium]|nr:sulfotransferase [Desulfobacteraceae bacterium]